MTKYKKGKVVRGTVTGIENYIKKYNIEDINDIVGTVKMN